MKNIYIDGDTDIQIQNKPMTIRKSNANIKNYLRKKPYSIDLSILLQTYLVKLKTNQSKT